mgnify:CR=1 FL=1
MRFDERFRRYTAQGFIEELLVAALGCRHVLVGDDFRFGCDRAGDFEFLKAAGLRHGFSVDASTTVEVLGGRVSSTRAKATRCR